MIRDFTSYVAVRVMQVTIKGRYPSSIKSISESHARWRNTERFSESLCFFFFYSEPYRMSWNPWTKRKNLWEAFYVPVKSSEMKQRHSRKMHIICGRCTEWSAEACHRAACCESGWVYQICPHVTSTSCVSLKKHFVDNGFNRTMKWRNTWTNGWNSSQWFFCRMAFCD